MRLKIAGGLVVGSLLMPPSVSAQTPVGTAFTYQGRLTQGALPADGSYDLRLTLFDAPTVGNVVAGPLTLPGVTVSQGLFTVSLDFGSAAFQGQARWLEIEVQPAGGGGYTTLSPRQQLTPSPGAVFSSYTDPLHLTILNASNLTSGTVPDARVSGTYAQALDLTNPANALSGDGASLTGLNASQLASGTVPSAVVSGTYSGAVTFPNPANAFAGDGSGLTNLNAQPKYVRTVVVSPVGTAVANGAALLAALAGITTASPTNPWLLKVEPGIYDLGASSLVMKPFVDVEGSGEGATEVTAAGHPAETAGTIQGAPNTELRSLTAQNTGGAAFATALLLDGVATRVSHLTAAATGGTTETRGVAILNSAAPLLRSVTASAASANGLCRSVIALSGSTPRLVDVAASSSGTGASNAGVYFDGNAAGELTNVRAAATGASVPPATNYGVYVLNGTMTVTGLVATAFGPGDDNEAFRTDGAAAPPLVLQSAVLSASGGTTFNLGLSLTSQTLARNVVTQAFGGMFAYGAFTFLTPVGTELVGVTSHGQGGTTASVGLYSAGDNGLVVRDLTATATGSGTNYGVLSGATVSLDLMNSRLAASGGADNRGLQATGATLVLTDTAIRASGAVSQGLRVQANTTLVVNRSILSGTNSILVTAPAIFRIGASQLAGTLSNTGGATFTCVGDYNGLFLPLNALCL